MQKPANPQKSLVPELGEIIKRGTKLYLCVEDRLYTIHFWDLEKLKPKPKANASGVLFRFKTSVIENQIPVYGWVYPGTLVVEGTSHA